MKETLELLEKIHGAIKVESYVRAIPEPGFGLTIVVTARIRNEPYQFIRTFTKQQMVDSTDPNILVEQYIVDANEALCKKMENINGTE